MITPRCEVSGSRLYNSIIFAIIPPSISISRKEFVFTDSEYCNNNDFTFAQLLDGTRGGGVEEWRSGGVEEWRSGGIEGAWPLARRAHVAWR
jgi:hypothetical protein